MSAQEIETALQAFAAAGAHRGLFYLSTPITTGLLELELMDELGISSKSQLRSAHADRWRESVVEVNAVNATRQAELFTDAIALGRVVVNPVHMDRPHWTQTDYDRLWRRLIAEFPVVLVPLTGWAYSRGARLEVALAIELGIPTIALDGSPHTAKELAGEAQLADEHIARNGWRASAGDLPIIRDEPAPGPVSPLVQRATTLVPQPDDGFALQVFVWLRKERDYQLRKFGTAADDEHTREFGLDPDGWWARQLETYFYRAWKTGLETPIGRQAAAKYVATACGMLESIARSHGWLPAPGVTSGEIHRPESSDTS